MLDLRVRRALIHAVDRASIIDGLYAGKTQALYFWMSPDDPFYPTIDLAVTRYEYDPARAARLLTEAGWSKGPDGVARNPTGDPLHVPLLNQFGAVEEQEATVVLNNWKVLGITSELTNLTPAQDRDGELRSKFAAASFNRRGIGYDQMVWLPQNLSSPENRWGGQNRNGYVNAVLGESWQKALATLDVRQREALFVEALKAMTADAVVNPTHFQPKAIVYRRGIVGPTQTWVGEAAIIWNIWDWRWT
jgi:peptide/nickel transport system substrate-binding protein